MVVEKSLTNELGEFSTKYESFKEHIAEVNKDVTAGAVAADGGFLTDHGPEHIKTVIDRASQLTRTEKCNLSNYEAFILLVAIHLHDVGNIHGRIRHQIRVSEIAEWLGPSVSRDAIERRTILQIAAAHTSGESEEKDTISQLPHERHILNRHVRPRLLAAILRFADELAEDRSRASRYLHETESVPRCSEVFHAFAYALHSLTINHDSREIELYFDMETKDATRKFGKKAAEIYLLDEILNRSVKLHLERVYAMSYMREWIYFDAIRVFVEVYGNGLEPIERIGYRLADHGYPNEPETGVYSLAPELSKYRDWNGDKVTGRALADRIDEATR